VAVTVPSDALVPTAEINAPTLSADALVVPDMSRKAVLEV
jgi:hypothetical protein